MSASSKKFWFESKYGFGWYPVNLRGALIVFLYFAYIIGTFLRIGANSQSVSEILIGVFPHFFGATIVLLFICYLTGQPINKNRLKI